MRNLVVGLAVLGWAQFAQATQYHWVWMDQQRLPSEQVLDMAQDDLGNKYYSSYSGLSLVDKSGNYRVFTKESTQGGLVSDSVTCLGVDRYRALWVGTTGGISVLANDQWTHYTNASTNGGLPDDDVTAMAIYRDQEWFATHNGFAMLHGTVWTTYTGDLISGRLPNHITTAIAVDSSGNKWIGTIGGLVKFDGVVWTTYTRASTSSGLPHDAVTYLLVDSSGALWIGTQAGVARLGTDRKWTDFQSDSRLGELSSELTYSLSQGTAGDVWACIRGGVAQYTGGDWKLYTKTTTPGLLTRYIYYVMPGLNGDTWFATEKGVITMVPAPDDE